MQHAHATATSNESTSGGICGSGRPLILLNFTQKRRALAQKHRAGELVCRAAGTATQPFMARQLARTHSCWNEEQSNDRTRQLLRGKVAASQLQLSGVWAAKKHNRTKSRRKYLLGDGGRSVHLTFHHGYHQLLNSSRGPGTRAGTIACVEGRQWSVREPCRPLQYSVEFGYG